MRSVNSLMITCLLALSFLSSPIARAGNVDLPRFPSINPDGTSIVFSWRGDLWLASSQGGQATRLTSHPADDLSSAFSDDGQTIAFESNRDGYQNIYVMNVDGTHVRQITFIDRPCHLAGFGIDAAGEPIITFAAQLESDVYRATRPYQVSVLGGEMTRLHDAYGFNPLVSADGNSIVFTRGHSRWSRRGYRGADNRDVWLFDRRNDSFRELADWAGNDGMARWAGEDSIIFASDRQFDVVNLYRTSARNPNRRPERLTNFRERDVWELDVSADGSTAVFTVWDQLYTLDLTRRNARPTALDISANEDDLDRIEVNSVSRDVTEAALHPSGKAMAYIAYGELFVRDLDEDSRTRRITNNYAHDRDIAWSPDGTQLYFTSDRDGTDSIYAATVRLTRSEVKSEYEDDEDMDKPADISDKDDERESDETTPAEPDDPEEFSEDNGDHEDDDKKDDDSVAKHWQEALLFEITPVVQTENNDRNAQASPDGTMLSFRRNRGDLILLNLETQEERAVIESWDSYLHWRWSPDSRWIAYATYDLDFNSDIWIVPADGSQSAVNVTQHPDNDEDPCWSADGRILTFRSERINEEYDVWTVYLDASLESLTPKELNEYYKDTADAAKKRKPLKVKEDVSDSDNDSEEAEEEEEKEKKDHSKKDEPEAAKLSLDDAYLRLKRITSLSGSESNVEMTPGGDRIIFSASVAGDTSLYSVKWDGSDRKKLADSGSVQHVSLTGDRVVYVRSGQAYTVKPSGSDNTTHEISATLRIDLEQQSSQKFLEAARIVGEWFYHPTMKGLDWSSLTDAYHQLAKNARTADEFNYVAERLIGELNGSHLGIRSSDSRDGNNQPYGRLGTDHIRVEGGYVVTGIVPDGPAEKSTTPLQVGDVIIAIDDEPLADLDTIESRLVGKVGVETLLTVRRPLVEPLDDEDGWRDVYALNTPISYTAERGLRYEAWQRDTAQLVDTLSDGRIGYIHIQGMNQPSLDEFERDLFAAAYGRDGLIIDVRNNGGGWTTDRVLSSIMVQPHAYTIPRGADQSKTGHYPQDRLFIQRYTLPMNLLCNEKSFSNAEIMSHAFKTLQRGTLVGQQTYGGVISTGGTRLIDGTLVRLPFRGWYLNDGTDMENNGAMPDIVVEQTPEAESRDDDEQLKAAVQDLLERLP